MDIAISRLSGGELLMPMTALQDALPYDPTGLPVSVAVIPDGPGDPATSDWHAARWVTASGIHWVMFIPDPGITTGLHRAWAKVTSTRDIVAKSTNQVYVY